MKIICNGYQLAQVFIPICSANLIVSEQVAERLLKVSSTYKLVPVKFDKVYRLPWSLSGTIKTEAWANKLIEQGKELSILENSKHDPLLATQIRKYYEVVTYNHYRLLEEHPSTHQLFTQFYDSPPLPHDLLPVSREIFHEYPITNAGFPVVRNDVFTILEQFADLRFFGMTVLSL